MFKKRREILKTNFKSLRLIEKKKTHVESMNFGYKL